MNTINHERRTWMPAYALTIGIVTTLLLAVRLLSRVTRAGGRWGVDDVFITIAWAVATVSIGVLVKLSASYGLDRHIWDTSPALWSKSAEYSWILAVLFIFSTAFTKVSVLLFYRRIVAGTYSKRFKWALWAGIGFIVVYSVSLFILLCVTCTPLEAQWRRLDPTYSTKFKCASVEQQQRISELGGVLSVITDFYSVLLPAILLLKIQISKRQKIGLIFIFGLGFLVVISGIVRTVYLSQAQGTSLDKTWLGFNVFAAGTVEGNIGIVCACAPSLKSCFRFYFKDHFTSLGSTIRSKGPWSSNDTSKTGRSQIISENSHVEPEGAAIQKSLELHDSADKSVAVPETEKSGPAQQPAFIYFVDSDTEEEDASLSKSAERKSATTAPKRGGTL